MCPSSFHANAGAQTVNAIRKTEPTKRMREQMLPNVTSASLPARTRFGRLEIEPRADLQLAGTVQGTRGCGDVPKGRIGNHATPCLARASPLSPRRECIA